ncbi:MAG: hypothetical protein AAGA54_22880 [Myxococcota bacterium]
MSSLLRSRRVAAMAACFVLGCVAAPAVSVAQALSCADESWTVDNPRVESLDGSDATPPAVPETLVMVQAYSGDATYRLTTPEERWGEGVNDILLGDAS